MTVVAADKLVRTYRRGPEAVHAVRDVSFALAAGELVVVAGPSGSGKTTLLNLLIGWEEPDAGAVRWGAATGAGWDQVAVVPQRLGLMAELTVAENVALPVRLGGGDPAAVDGLLERLGLAALGDRLPEQVSMGEQQRTAIARAMVRRPALLLADEPTGHQDEAWVHGVLDVLSDVTSGGTACLVATHDADVLARADRVLRLADGRLVSGG